MPLWQTPIVYVLGLALMYIASLVGLGGSFYAGDLLAMIGALTCIAAIFVAGYGYLLPFLLRFGKEGW